MTEAAIELEQAIQHAASQYFRLVILAGAPASDRIPAQRFPCRTLALFRTHINPC
jgi:hypothetical protein